MVIVVPKSLAKLVIKAGFNLDQIRKLKWGEKTKIDNIKIRSFQVEHHSKYKNGFTGYVLSDGRNSIVFFGDTSYMNYRDYEISNRVRRNPITCEREGHDVEWKARVNPKNENINLAIIPIGDSCYYYNHIGPKNALKLAREINAKKLLPVHYGTFILSCPEKYSTKAKCMLLEEIVKSKKNNSMVLFQTVDDSQKKAFPDIGVQFIVPSNR
jgi:L-ascorbate metabolism protein UlaG (beta-lactamase superfamily)